MTAKTYHRRVTVLALRRELAAVRAERDQLRRAIAAYAALEMDTARMRSGNHDRQPQAAHRRG